MAEPTVPARLAPFLSQWDYMRGVLDERLAGLTDEEYFWAPTSDAWTDADALPRRGDLAHAGSLRREPRIR